MSKGRHRVGTANLEAGAPVGTIVRDTHDGWTYVLLSNGWWVHTREPRVAWCDVGGTPHLREGLEVVHWPVGPLEPMTDEEFDTFMDTMGRSKR